MRRKSRPTAGVEVPGVAWGGSSLQQRHTTLRSRAASPRLARHHSRRPLPLASPARLGRPRLALPSLTINKLCAASLDKIPLSCGSFLSDSGLVVFGLRSFLFPWQISSDVR
ncbi:hypothetical protein E2C01_020460 [Portunus trituberculatus]|uniref:Uncharacterized protein n=1 Tax=Portunus trituberculatus TaxID=210409 RepID=A0A5B7DZT9_PORTR|nr:hypothetical protein [Portunus trituberculatus]